MKPKGKPMMVPLNDLGRRIGQHHHNAKFTDEIIDKIRDMREDMAMTYQQIAEAVGISKHVIAKICRYERRAQTPHRWIKVIKHEKGD